MVTLRLEIDRQARDRKPIYRQIADQVIGQIRDGSLPNGSQLPTVRELADRLENARIIPLELFFGGSSGGSGVIEYRDNLEMLKLLKIFDTGKEIKELKEGMAKKENPLASEEEQWRPFFAERTSTQPVGPRWTRPPTSPMNIV